MTWIELLGTQAKVREKYLSDILFFHVQNNHAKEFNNFCAYNTWNDYQGVYENLKLKKLIDK